MLLRFGGEMLVYDGTGELVTPHRRRVISEMAVGAIHALNGTMAFSVAWEVW